MTHVIDALGRIKETWFPTVHDHSSVPEGGTHWGGITQTFGGGSGANIITLPDNLAQALNLVDAGGLEYLRIVSTDAQPIIDFNNAGVDIDIYLRSVGVTGLFVQGSDGALTVGGPSMAVPDGWTLGQAAGPLLTFDDTLNTLDITGGSMRVAGAWAGPFAAGAGIEMQYAAGVSYIQSYDRTGATNQPLYISGNPILLNAGVEGDVVVGAGVGQQQLTVADQIFVYPTAADADNGVQVGLTGGSDNANLGQGRLYMTGNNVAHAARLDLNAGTVVASQINMRAISAAAALGTLSVQIQSDGTTYFNGGPVVAGGTVAVGPESIEVQGGTAGVSFVDRGAATNRFVIYNNAGNLRFWDGADRLLIAQITGHVYPGGNKTQDLGLAGNRWREIFSSLALNTGTSRLVPVQKNCAVDGTQLVRSTGGLRVLGEESDFLLAFCPTCGTVAMEELRHRTSPITKPAPKVVLTGMEVLKHSGNTKSVVINFRYGDDVEGEMGTQKAPHNSTTLSDDELAAFLGMADDKERRAFLLNLGQIEWNALEKMEVIEPELDNEQAQIDLAIRGLIGKDLSKEVANGKPN